MNSLSIQHEGKNKAAREKNSGKTREIKLLLQPPSRSNEARRTANCGRWNGRRQESVPSSHRSAAWDYEVTGGSGWGLLLNPGCPHHCVCNGNNAAFDPILQRQLATVPWQFVRRIQVGIHHRASGLHLGLPRVSLRVPSLKGIVKERCGCSL